MWVWCWRGGRRVSTGGECEHDAEEEEGGVSTGGECECDAEEEGRKLTSSAPCCGMYSFNLQPCTTCFRTVPIFLHFTLNVIFPQSSATSKGPVHLMSSFPPILCVFFMFLTSTSSPTLMVVLVLCLASYVAFCCSCVFLIFVSTRFSTFISTSALIFCCVSSSVSVTVSSFLKYIRSTD